MEKDRWGQTSSGYTGGSDWIVAPGGDWVIAGVSSACEAKYLADAPRISTWVIETNGPCSSEGIWKVRNEILDIMSGLPGTFSGDASKAPGASVVSQQTFCGAYADEAVASANENIASACGGSGARWTTDRAQHVAWCMGLDGDRTVPNAEARVRAAALTACKAAHNPPAVEPGTDPVEPDPPADPAAEQPPADANDQ